LDFREIFGTFNTIDLIYFDALVPGTARALDGGCFAIIVPKALKKRWCAGNLSERSVRRARQAVGCVETDVPGPPGKEKCSEPVKGIIK